MNALLDNAYLLTAEAADVGDKTADAMQVAMAGLSASLAEDLDPNPTIRPVLDLSDIESGSARMNGLFADPRVGIGAYNTAALAARVNAAGGPTYERYASQPAGDWSELADRLDILADEMTHLQVVMETGALVGQIAPSVNRALGREFTRNTRGG